jgi:hypothetical protein
MRYYYYRAVSGSIYVSHVLTKPVQNFLVVVVVFWLVPHSLPVPYLHSGLIKREKVTIALLSVENRSIVLTITIGVHCCRIGLSSFLLMREPARIRRLP